jgi:hypothetical protein
MEWLVYPTPLQSGSVQAPFSLRSNSARGPTAVTKQQTPLASFISPMGFFLKSDCPGPRAELERNGSGVKAQSRGGANCSA